MNCDHSFAPWLWSGKRGRLAGLAAARLHGSEWIDEDQPVELIWRNPHPPAGVITSKRQLQTDEITRISGLPLTTPARTAFDVGRRLPRHQAVARLDALMRATPFSTAQVSTLDWLLDMGWEEFMVAAEYDGDQHRSDRAQYVKDIRRLKAITEQGWSVIARLSRHLNLCDDTPGVLAVAAVSASAGSRLRAQMPPSTDPLLRAVVFVLYDRSVPVGRLFQRLVDLLPLPSLRVQRLIAAAVVLTQGGIAVTGAIVRVTASGLGCPTWPQCFPGSFTPVAVAEVPHIHQAVEFGNRLITFAVVLTAILAVVAVTRARRRREVLVYAWLMPISTVVQAVIGGITVLTGLLWWTVAIHLLASMTMVWVSVLLFVKVGEPDAGDAELQVPKRLRTLTGLSAIVLALVLVAGTFVTAAGPHAGDKSVQRVVPRLELEILTLVRAHSSLMLIYLALLIGLGVALIVVHAGRPVLLRLGVLVALVCAQGLVGTVQYFTGVPAALVALHVAGAAACTAAAAALWAAMRERTETESVQS